jgi:predicted phosphodiesterase
MVISDLHYDKRIFEGIDESRAWEWLLSIVNYHKPDLLLSCGDWGIAISFEEFYELLKKTIVLSIYGNHENMGVLVKLYNIRLDRHLPVLMEDGKIYEVGGFRIAGINGIIVSKRKVKKGIPRKVVEDFLDTAKRLRGKKVDILLIHETPYLPNLFPFMRDSEGSRIALRAIETILPKIVFNGHMHYGGYKTCRIGKSVYVYIDSSQKHRHYAVLNSKSYLEVEIWRNLENVDLIHIE